MREILKKIIALTTNIEDNGEVWGKDAELGNIEELLDEAEAILKEELINRPERLRKRILLEMVDWGGFTLKELIEEVLPLKGGKQQ